MEDLRSFRKCLQEEEKSELTIAKYTRDVTKFLQWLQIMQTGSCPIGNCLSFIVPDDLIYPQLICFILKTLATAGQLRYNSRK